MYWLEIEIHLDHWQVEVDDVVIQPVETLQGLEVVARYTDPANYQHIHLLLKDSS